MTHSGLQFGGEPIMSGRQVHRHLLPLILGGSEFGPHGFGTHGSSNTTGATAVNMLMSMVQEDKQSFINLVFSQQDALCLYL